jgi:hypothetical protein
MYRLTICCFHFFQVKKKAIDICDICDCIEDLAPFSCLAMWGLSSVSYTAILLRAAQKFWTTHDGSSWTLDEFAALRNSEDFSEDLVALVRRKTHKMIGKPDIGYDIARSLNDRSEIPNQILLCIEHAYDAANASE